MVPVQDTKITSLSIKWDSPNLGKIVFELREQPVDSVLTDFLILRSNAGYGIKVLVETKKKIKLEHLC